MRNITHRDEWVEEISHAESDAANEKVEEGSHDDEPTKPAALLWMMVQSVAGFCRRRFMFGVRLDLLSCCSRTHILLSPSVQVAKQRVFNVNPSSRRRLLIVLSSTCNCNNSVFGSVLNIDQLIHSTTSSQVYVCIDKLVHFSLGVCVQLDVRRFA